MDSTENKVRFGIIGAGMISAFHAKAISAIKNAELIGVFDKDAHRAEKFSKLYGGRVYESMEAVLADENIDAVCICTPSGLHAQNAILAVNAGKHVAIEKPISLTVKEANQVIEACRENNVIGTVMSQLRYSDDIQRVKAAISEGVFGKIVLVHLKMKYYRMKEYYDSSSLRGTWAMDGGALMNQSIHGVDIVNYLMGGITEAVGFIKTIAKNIESEDTSFRLMCPMKLLPIKEKP